MTGQRGLTPEQLGMLLTPLQPGRVRQQQGQSHLEAWDVRRWLTRIFGFAGWDETILSLECVHSVTSPVGNDPAPLKHRCTAVYRVTLRLTIKDQQGNVIGHFDEGATGDSVNQPSVGDAHDMALKTALSQALKRCAINLGDQFGLSLYNKGDVGGVVGRTLGHAAPSAPGALAAPEDAPVLGGELDEPREGVDGPQYQVADAVARKAAGEQMVDIAPRGQVNPFDPEFELPPSLGTASARPATDAQLARLAILVGEKRGVSGGSKQAKARRLEILGDMVCRVISTGRDLTLREASELIERLSLEPDHVVEEAPPDGTVDPDQVEADLLAAIQGAGDARELGEAYVKAEAAARTGAIGTAALAVLYQAVQRRNDLLAADTGWSHRLLAEQTAVAS